MKPIRIAIFASGRGSNAMALIQKAQILAESLQIVFVLTDQPAAEVIEKAQGAGVRTIVVPKTSDKAHHEGEILKHIFDHQIDWIFLAGYMRLISADFLKKFSDRVGGHSQVVNIHPSLLPAYPGMDSIARAFHDGVSESGVTIHLVDDGMDTGKVLLQEALQISQGENLESFEKRIHQLEHRLYAQFLQDVGLQKQATQKFKV